MSSEHITFLVIGIVLIVLAVPMFFWFWHSYRYPISENELAYSNWFMSWIKKNKATIILMFTIVVLITGIAFVAGGSFLEPADV